LQARDARLAHGALRTARLRYAPARLGERDVVKLKLLLCVSRNVIQIEAALLCVRYRTDRRAPRLLE
jgi:hypothetical protein